MKKEWHVCPKCATDMICVLGDDSAEIWECPNCQPQQLHIRVADAIAVDDSVGLRTKSIEEDRHLGAREGARVALDDRVGQGVAGCDVDRTVTPGRAKRWVKHRAPYYTDAAGKQKKSEELDAVRRLLPVYNQHHHTDFLELDSDSEDQDADVTAISRSGRFPSLRCQVTKPVRDIWMDLHRSGEHEVETDEAELAEQIWQAIVDKSFSGGPDLVLVLDGWGVIAEGTLDQMLAECAEQIQSVSFREVWYCERGAGGMIRRLK